MVEIRVTGFRNQQQAGEFIIWYGEQGEQDFCTWLECQDVNSGLPQAMNLDVNKNTKWKDGVIEMPLEIFE